MGYRARPGPLSGRNYLHDLSNGCRGCRFGASTGLWINSPGPGKDYTAEDHWQPSPELCHSPGRIYSGGDVEEVEEVKEAEEAEESAAAGGFGGDL